MSIPNDPAILLSYINTQLRDNYNSLEELSKSLCVSADDIISKLYSIGYEYNAEQNRFIWWKLHEIIRMLILLLKA